MIGEEEGRAPHSQEMKKKVAVAVVEKIALGHWLGGGGKGAGAGKYTEARGSVFPVVGVTGLSVKGQPGDRSEMEKGLFTSLGRSWIHQGRTHVKTSADAAHQSLLPNWLRTSDRCPWAVRCRWQRSRSRSLWPPSCVSFSPAICISGLVSGLRAFTCIWVGLCLLDRAGRKSEA